MLEKALFDSKQLYNSTTLHFPHVHKHQLQRILTTACWEHLLPWFDHRKDGTWISHFHCLPHVFYISSMDQVL